MKEISEIKFQISASVKKETVEAIQKLLDEERRSFSSMVDILLAEALKTRQIALK